MKIKKLLSLVLTVMLIVCAVPMGAFNLTASAATSGYYTYTVSNGKATITNCNTSISGDVMIPRTLGGYPVTTIGDGAFSYCTSLTSITIPNSVTSIGYLAFYNCTSLTNVYITDLTAWCNIDFYDTYSNPMYYADNLYLNGELITNITIPDGVTSIGDNAFYNCTSLTSIIIPDSVTSIGSYAFYYCDSLTSITIPDGVTSIEYGVFYNCSSLTSITIPDSVTSIGFHAFYNCSSLTNVYINDLAAWCNIDFIDFYSTPMYYADNLYLNGEIITNITIPDGVTGIGDYTFYYCFSLTSITIPDSVTSIGEEAFYNCYNLTSINLPDSVTSIGNNAFRYCNRLTNVYINDLAAWCNIDFYDSYSNPMLYAKNIYLNNVLLTDLYIPQDKQIIGTNQFYGFGSVENIFIPKSVVLIKQNAFSACSGIKNIYFEGTAEEWAAVSILAGNDYLKNATVYFDCTKIPGGIIGVALSKLPDKLNYIENKESLDLTGGVLTVYYDGGATLDIDLSTLSVTGFDNSVLGKQTLTTRYGDYSVEFEIEIITRPISFVSMASFPNNREYIMGKNLDLTGGKIIVVYPEGVYDLFDLTIDMISGYDMNKTGYQILTVTYKNHTTEFAVRIFKSGDINGDDSIDATDIALFRKNLLSGLLNKTIYDMNEDGETDLRDLIRLKKNLAGITA